MTAPSAHYSRGLSTLCRPNMRRVRLTGATFDRYGAIRSFFWSQTVVLSHPDTAAPTNVWGSSSSGTGICRRKPKGCSFLEELFERNGRLKPTNMRLFDKRPFQSVVGLNFQVRNTRWIHANIACMAPADAYENADLRCQVRPSASHPRNAQPPQCTCKPPTSQPSHAQLTPYLYSNKYMDPVDPQKYLKNYSRFFRRLALSLPHAHRPTREDFLNVATGFWQRLRIRFKWFTIKSFRKFNADDISAFVTWFLMSQTLWILVGTWVTESIVLSHLLIGV